MGLKLMFKFNNKGIIMLKINKWMYNNLMIIKYNNMQNNNSNITINT